MSELSIARTYHDEQLAVLRKECEQLTFASDRIEEAQCFLSLGSERKSLVALAPKLHALPFSLGVLKCKTMTSYDALDRNALNSLFDRFAGQKRSATVALEGKLIQKDLREHNLEVYYGCGRLDEAGERDFRVGVSLEGLRPKHGDLSQFRLEFYQQVISLLNLSAQIQLYPVPLTDAKHGCRDVEANVQPPWYEPLRDRLHEVCPDVEFNPVSTEQWVHGSIKADYACDHSRLARRHCFL